MTNVDFAKVAAVAEKCNDFVRHTILPVKSEFVCVAENHADAWLSLIGGVSDLQDGVGVIDFGGVEAIRALREACDRVLRQQEED